MYPSPQTSRENSLITYAVVDPKKVLKGNDVVEHGIDLGESNGGSHITLLFTYNENGAIDKSSPRSKNT